MKVIGKLVSKLTIVLLLAVYAMAGKADVQAPPSVAMGCKLRSGMSLVISLVDHTNVMHAGISAGGEIVPENTPNCGWYGCRVALMVGTDLSLNHGSSGPAGYPEPFTLVKEGAPAGDCLRYGDRVSLSNNKGMQLVMDNSSVPRVMRERSGSGTLFYLRAPYQYRAEPQYQNGQPLTLPARVVFAMTPAAGDTSNCGWYGCRVLQEHERRATVNHGRAGRGGFPASFFLYPPICGDRGQPACNGLNSTSCRLGLAPDPITSQCDDVRLVRQRMSQLESGGQDPAQLVTDVSKEFVNNPGKLLYILDGRFQRDIEANNLTAIDAQLGLTAYAGGQLRAIAGPFKSVSVGVGVDGGLAAGLAGELGVVADIALNPAIRIYRAFALQAGTIAGIGVSATIGVSTDVAVNSRGEGNALSGGVGCCGITVSFDTVSGNPNGMAVSAGAGIQVQKLALPVDLRASTSLTQIYSGGLFILASSWDGGPCGESGIRPCHFIERIPSCNAGFKENFLAHRCIPANAPFVFPSLRSNRPEAPGIR